MFIRNCKCTLVYEQHFTSHNNFHCKNCDCVVKWTVASQSGWFCKHNVLRFSCKHDIRCIVIFSWNRRWGVDEAHTIEICWYQPSVKGLLFKAFCHLVRTTVSVSKVMFYSRHESFSEIVFASRYLSLPIDDRAVVVALWSPFPVSCRVRHAILSCFRGVVDGFTVLP